jgi:hypothetical protein
MRTDMQAAGQTDMTKLIDAFRYSVNAPKDRHHMHFYTGSELLRSHFNRILRDKHTVV